MSVVAKEEWEFALEQGRNAWFTWIQYEPVYNMQEGLIRIYAQAFTNGRLYERGLADATG